MRKRHRINRHKSEKFKNEGLVIRHLLRVAKIGLPETEDPVDLLPKGGLDFGVYGQKM
jgi:hypothetical protein